MPEETGPHGTPPEDGHRSLWNATTPGTDYDALDDGLRVDAAVVGGGIVGLTAAIELVEAGREVAVLEAERVVAGTTGHTTAKLTSCHGLQYAALRDDFGHEAARQYADANEAAIDAVEARIDDLGIDADFERRPAYTYAHDPDDLDDVRAEARAAAALDLPASFESETDLPFDVPGAVRFADQAQFHPRKYLLPVAEAVVDAGGHVFEQTRVRDVDPGEPCRLATERGEVVADDVVVASHFPVLDRAGCFARLRPRRAYLLGVRIAGEPPEGMYLSTRSPPDTMRSHALDPADVEALADTDAEPADEPESESGDPATGSSDPATESGDPIAEIGDPAVGERLLIVGGQQHAAGEGSTEERYRRCAGFAREHFDVESIEYRWSTHDHWSVDGVPLVGRAGPGVDHAYVATGFSGWGMTNGVAAGRILAGLIVDGEHPHADVFDPLRVTPAASARGLLAGGASVARHLVGDRATSLLAPDELPDRGEAAVRSTGGHPVAIHRDDDGEVHAVSASCTHLGCVVAWNDAEETWDCPCHGSRFGPDGDVVAGPAVDDLPERRP